jgi:hypothetical protein
MVDAVGVEERGAALDAVDDVPFFEQEFGQVRSVLTRNAGNQCNLLRHDATFHKQVQKFRTKSFNLQGWTGDIRDLKAELQAKDFILNLLNIQVKKIIIRVYFLC